MSGLRCEGLPFVVFGMINMFGRSVLLGVNQSLSNIGTSLDIRSFQGSLLGFRSNRSSEKIPLVRDETR